MKCKWILIFISLEYLEQHLKEGHQIPPSSKCLYTWSLCPKWRMETTAKAMMGMSPTYRKKNTCLAGSFWEKHSGQENLFNWPWVNMYRINLESFSDICN